MQQPPGFIHSEFPNHVWKLQKAISGLRQAPRAWHESLKNFVISVGFSISLSDPSLFIYNKDGVRAFLLVYVDELLLTGNNTSFLNQFMTKLSKKFSLKQLGFPHYFLGIELIPVKTGLFLSQHGYIRELLYKFHMTGAKSTKTPYQKLCGSQIFWVNLAFHIKYLPSSMIILVPLTYVQIQFFIQE